MPTMYNPISSRALLISDDTDRFRKSDESLYADCLLNVNEEADIKRMLDSTIREFHGLLKPTLERWDGKGIADARAKLETLKEETRGLYGEEWFNPASDPSLLHMLSDDYDSSYCAFGLILLEWARQGQTTYAIDEDLYQSLREGIEFSPSLFAEAQKWDDKRCHLRTLYTDHFDNTAKEHRDMNPTRLNLLLSRFKEADETWRSLTETILEDPLDLKFEGGITLFRHPFGITLVRHYKKKPLPKITNKNMENYLLQDFFLNVCQQFQTDEIYAYHHMFNLKDRNQRVIMGGFLTSDMLLSDMSGLWHTRTMFRALRCLQSSTTRFRKGKRTRGLVRRNRHKAPHISPRYRYLIVDPTLLSTVRYIPTPENQRGSEKCQHPRSETFANTWVLRKNLLNEEEIIATKTSRAGNKLYLVKRHREGTVVNPHRPVGEKKPIVYKMRSAKEGN